MFASCLDARANRRLRPSRKGPSETTKAVSFSHRMRSCARHRWSERWVLWHISCSTRLTFPANDSNSNNAAAYVTNASFDAPWWSIGYMCTTHVSHRRRRWAPHQGQRPAGVAVLRTAAHAGHLVRARYRDLSARLAVDDRRLHRLTRDPLRRHRAVSLSLVRVEPAPGAQARDLRNRFSQGASTTLAFGREMQAWRRPIVPARRARTSQRLSCAS